MAAPVPLRYGSVCSGYDAATIAWHPLGWRPAFFSEIEAAPRAVLAHRYPEVPLHGDFTTIQAGDYEPIDLLVGGTPCQDFSIAGLRAGLDGARGNLTLEYGRLARRLRPRRLVWENVPGVLSSNGGRDFACVLGLFAGRTVGVPAGGWQNFGVIPGYANAYGLAYRVLDAQYIRVDGFGRAVPQRRRRVFVVGYIGDWRRAAAVLLERAGLCGDPAPRREAGADAACGTLGGTSPGGGWRLGADEAAAGQLVAERTGFHLQSVHGGERGDLVADMRVVRPRAFGGNDTRGPIEVASCLNGHGGPHGRLDFTVETFIAEPIAFHGSQDPDVSGEVTHPVGRNGGLETCIAFSCKDYGADATDGGAAPTLRAMGHGESHANAGGRLAIAFGHNGGPPLSDWAVRRLTPRECERLQGAPDDYTLVPWRGGLMPDGPRYKMLGNSMAANVMRWLGQRISMVDALPSSSLPASADSISAHRA